MKIRTVWCFLLMSAQSWAAATGRLQVTQGLQNFSTEIQVVSSVICAIAAVVFSWDYFNNRGDLSMIGKGALGTFAATGFAASAPYLLTLIPGSLGFTI